MVDLNVKHQLKVGQAPGTMIYVGAEKRDKTRISVFDYDIDNITSFDVLDIEVLEKYVDSATNTWINVIGVHNTKEIEDIGRIFHIHPLVLEDVINTNQRPKTEMYDNFVYIVLKMLYIDEKSNDVTIEQVSIIVGENYVITFQETEIDVFDSIRKRISSTKWRVRRLGADYLTYALIDAIVDNYFIVLEHLNEVVEELEDEMLSNSKPDYLQMVYRLKRTYIYIRKMVYPVRELLNMLMRTEIKQINDETRLHYRDVYDHLIRVLDTIEHSRELLSSIVEIHITSISQKMNEVMKVLTIIATIFIPLTFIAGIYGMNFKNMPELEWEWGYFASIGLMALIAIGMVLYIVKKKWL